MSAFASARPIRSMTGYARARASCDLGEIAITLRSVNHRGLDLHFHLAPEIDPHENLLRVAMKESLVRGHIDVRVAFTPSAKAAPVALNAPMLRAWLAAFTQAKRESNQPDADPDLNAALRLPGMFLTDLAVETDGDLEQPLSSAIHEALQQLNEFRSREGAELADFIHRQNESVLAGAAAMEQIRHKAVPMLQARLADRLQELLRSTSIDPQRIAQEAAILADRGDVGEETARLRIHAAHLDELLSAGGEVGKKLDFLLQEMNRETNTILSKTNGIGDLGLKITEIALAAKASIEKIREQALNLE